MKNFNSVFAAIKEDCYETDVSNTICYNNLVKSFQGKIDRPVHFYLETFNIIGLITYNKEMNSIAITTKGHLTKDLSEYEE